MFWFILMFGCKERVSPTTGLKVIEGNWYQIENPPGMSPNYICLLYQHYFGTGVICLPKEELLYEDPARTSLCPPR